MTYTTVLTSNNNSNDPELMASNIKQEVIIYYIKKKGISVADIARMSNTRLLPSEIHGILISVNPNQLLLNKLYREIIPSDFKVSTITTITIFTDNPI